MVSIEFLYFFLPLFIGIYAAFPSSQRVKLLALAAVGIVLWSSPVGAVPLLAAVLSGYFGGRLIDKFHSRAVTGGIILAAVVAVNIGIAALFACLNHSKATLAFSALGKNSLSRLITFGVAICAVHSVKYCADIYKGRFAAEKSFFTVFGYITFFPVLTAGPILDFDSVRETLKSPQISSERLADGIRIFLIGLAKKLIFSNGLFECWQSVRGVSPSGLSSFDAWFGIIIFSLCFYYEMSAYSDMARGLSSMLGFEIPKNFDSPYAAKSFYGMLRRFNITLADFVKNYICNSITSFGNSKILWGFAVVISTAAAVIRYAFGKSALLFALITALVIILEKALEHRLEAMPAFLRKFLSLLIFLLILPLLASPDIKTGFGYLGAMFGSGAASEDVLSAYLIKTSTVITIIAIFCSTGIFKYLTAKLGSMSEYILTVIKPVTVIVLLLLDTAFLVSGSGSMFGCLF
jgi:alginate O-acetyltransferase complex protein AlgI